MSYYNDWASGVSLAVYLKTLLLPGSLPNVIKIVPYNFELYRFKVGAFFDTQCRLQRHSL